MTFIFWECEEGDHHGIPLSSIKELQFQPGDPALDEDESALEIHVGEEYFEVTGKAARRAWDEIKMQIANAPNA